MLHVFSIYLMSENGEMIQKWRYGESYSRYFQKSERWFKNEEMISHIAGIFKKWRDGSKMER